MRIELLININECTIWATTEDRPGPDPAPSGRLLSYLLRRSSHSTSAQKQSSPNLGRPSRRSLQSANHPVDIVHQPSIQCPRPPDLAPTNAISAALAAPKCNPATTGSKIRRPAPSIDASCNEGTLHPEAMEEEYRSPTPQRHRGTKSQSDAALGLQAHQGRA